MKLELERRVQQLDEEPRVIEAHCIALLRPVEDQPGDVTVLLEKDMFFRH